MEWKSGLASTTGSIAALLTSLLVAYNLTLAPDDATIPRYVQPMLLAAAVAGLMTWAAVPRGRTMVWALSVLVLLATLPERARTVMACYAQLGRTDKLVLPFSAQDIADHRRVQALVPEGKRILVCSDYPLLFDHARNPIWSIDLPHAASPAPGLPYQKPLGETKEYLHRLGVEYVIFVNFDTASLYSRAQWQKYTSEGVPLMKIEAPFFLDFFATAESLAVSETKLGQVGKLTAVQLNP